MKTAIITGITGQDAAYLSKLLLEKDYKVVCITRSLQTGSLNGLSFIGIENDAELVEASVFDLFNIICDFKINNFEKFYIHTAQRSVGMSFVAQSFSKKIFVILPPYSSQEVKL